MSRQERPTVRRWRRWLGWVTLALSALAILLGTLAPAVAIGWLRGKVPGFAVTWDWLDASLPGWNPLHVILYAWVAMLWRGLAARPMYWRGVVLLVICSVMTELLQLLVPGRSARVSDVLNDLLGIGLGWLLGVAMLRLARRAPARSPGAESPRLSVPVEPGRQA